MVHGVHEDLNAIAEVGHCGITMKHFKLDMSGYQWNIEASRHKQNPCPTNPLKFLP